MCCVCLCACARALGLKNKQPTWLNVQSKPCLLKSDFAKGLQFLSMDRLKWKAVYGQWLTRGNPISNTSTVQVEKKSFLLTKANKYQLWWVNKLCKQIKAQIKAGKQKKKKEQCILIEHSTFLFHKLKNLVSHSICLKFSGKTPGAPSNPQFVFLYVAIFSLVTQFILEDGPGGVSG